MITIYPRVTALEFMEQGIHLYQQGKTAEALLIFDQAKLNDSELPDLNHWRSLAKTRLAKSWEDQRKMESAASV